MPHTDYALARLFLLTSATLFLGFCALPLLFAPLVWARVFQWKIPTETDLTVYLGRCVGGVATAIVAACYVAAARPESNVLLFDIIAAVGALMTAIHVWGAIRRVQPWTETAEIALYVALTVLAIAARPGM